MTMTPQELQRRVTQQGNDVDAIYEMLGTISMTQTHHGRRLNDVEAKIDGLDTKIDGVDTKIDGVEGRLTARLDSLDGRLDSLDGRLDSLDGRLESLEINVTEILRRLPG